MKIQTVSVSDLLWAVRGEVLCRNSNPATMTKEEEIPDWVGAHEFYDKYEPKEILGRYVYEVLN